MLFVERHMQEVSGRFSEMDARQEAYKRIAMEEERQRKEQESKHPWRRMTREDVRALFGIVAFADIHDVRQKGACCDAFAQAQLAADRAVGVQSMASLMTQDIQDLFDHKTIDTTEYWCKDLGDVDQFVKDFLPKQATQDERAFVKICVFLCAYDIGKKNIYFVGGEASKFLYLEIKQLMNLYLQCKGVCMFKLEKKNEETCSLGELEMLRRGQLLIVLPSVLNQDGQQLSSRNVVAKLRQSLLRAMMVHRDILALESVHPRLYQILVDGFVAGIKEHWYDEAPQRTLLAHDILTRMRLHDVHFQGFLAKRECWIDDVMTGLMYQGYSFYGGVLEHQDVLALSEQYMREALKGLTINVYQQQREIVSRLQESWKLETPVTCDLEGFVLLTKAVMERICVSNSVDVDRVVFEILEERIRLKEACQARKSFILMDAGVTLTNYVDESLMPRSVYLKDVITQEMSYMQRGQIARDLLKKYGVEGVKIDER